MRPRSAGSVPADEVNPVVVEALAEVGLDIGGEIPSKLAGEAVTDVVVTMGCRRRLSRPSGNRHVDREPPDPAGLPLESTRTIRDDIERRVLELHQELTGVLS